MKLEDRIAVMVSRKRAELDDIDRLLQRLKAAEDTESSVTALQVRVKDDAQYIAALEKDLKEARAKVKDLEARPTPVYLMSDGDFLGRHTLNPLPMFTKDPAHLRPGMPVEYRVANNNVPSGWVSVRGTLVAYHHALLGAPAPYHRTDYWTVDVPGCVYSKTLMVPHILEHGVTIFVTNNGVAPEPKNATTWPQNGEVWEWVTQPSKDESVQIIGQRFTINDDRYRYSGTGVIGTYSLAAVAKHARKVS